MKKTINDYSKEEIIAAIKFLDKHYGLACGGNVRSYIERALFELATEKAQKKVKKALAVVEEKEKALNEWIKDIKQKYGGDVKFINLLPDELQKWSELNENYVKAVSRLNRAWEKEDKLYKDL